MTTPADLRQPGPIRHQPRRRGLRAGLLVAALGALAADQAATAEPIVLRFDPAATTIRFTLGATLHTVEGTAPLTSGTVTLDPTNLTVTGALIVDARAVATGSNGRDEDMHAKVLESGRFATIELRPERLVGRLPDDGSEGSVELVGRFLLHGAEQPLRFPLTVRRAGPTWQLDGSFTVPYVAWGLRDPSKLFLRVDPHVTVTVRATATAVPGSDVAPATPATDPPPGAPAQ